MEFMLVTLGYVNCTYLRFSYIKFKLLYVFVILVSNSFFSFEWCTRLLEETDADLQLMVLDCLLNWNDEWLLPYSQHLKDLINAKNLREELTTWSLSRESIQIDEQHRNYIVPIVIRILVPKVRKLKALASRKVFLYLLQKFLLCAAI